VGAKASPHTRFSIGFREALASKIVTEKSHARRDPLVREQNLRNTEEVSADS
jgi:hypothetical protein